MAKEYKIENDEWTLLLESSIDTSPTGCMHRRHVCCSKTSLATIEITALAAMNKEMKENST